ncbi:cytoplasmic protein, partial [Mesorhizobium sp. M7A.F.Ca.CA.002.09.1.1]
DIGPHWLPHSFVEWPGYARLWTNVLRWVSNAV